MVNITKILSEEHQNILKVIDVVIEECKQLEIGKEIDHDFFRNVIHFIKNYADGFHHVKEEDILFKAMLKEAENMHCNPIPVMLHEHDKGRQYVKGMEDALYNNNVEILIENAKGYSYLLQDHIYKEDNILYPMAEEALNDSQKQHVEALYAKVDVNVFMNDNINVFMENMFQKQNK